jgi:hypothetical protein
LTTPAAANKRFLIGGLDYSSAISAEALRKIPEIASRVAKDSGEVPLKAKVDAREATEVLNLSFKSADETFGDTARRLLELEKQFQK